MAIEERAWTRRHTSALIKHYPALAESVPAARREVKAFARRAGADERTLEGVELAASEALTNVVLHAYADDPGQIHLTAMLSGDELWLMVGDDGDGLRAATRSPGLGLGLGLIAQMAEELTIVERAEGGIELRMRFDLDDSWDESCDQPRGSLSAASRPASPRFSITR